MKKKIFIAFAIILFGCDKHTSDDEYDEYYIKYEVNSSTIYIGGKLNINFSDENNKSVQVLTPTRAPWEIIIGPVKKGFNARLRVDCTAETYNQLRLQGQISVSKNSSSFSVKKIDTIDTPRDSFQTNYTIDF